MTPNAIKKAKFTKGKVGGLSNAEAARQAGCPAKTAKQQGHRLANDPEVKEAISEALKDYDIKKAVEEIDEVRRLALEGSEGNPPQLATALKGTDMKCKLANLYPEEKKKVEVSGNLDMKNTFTFAQLCEADEQSIKVENDKISRKKIRNTKTGH